MRFEDGHATDSSFPSFDLLDGSGVVGSYGYAREGEDNQPLEQSRLVSVSLWLVGVGKNWVCIDGIIVSKSRVPWRWILVAPRLVQDWRVLHQQ